MQSINDRQRALLGQLPRQQRTARVVGIVCSLVGILYIVWAVDRFHPRVNPAEGVGFDAIVTEPVATLFAAHQQKLGARTFENPRERALARHLYAHMTFSAGLLVLAFRVILGLIVTLLGFATLTVMIERARLLRILEAAGVHPATGTGPLPSSAVE